MVAAPLSGEPDLQENIGNLGLVAVIGDIQVGFNATCPVMTAMIVLEVLNITILETQSDGEGDGVEKEIQGGTQEAARAAAHECDLVLPPQPDGISDGLHLGGQMTNTTAFLILALLTMILIAIIIIDGQDHDGAGRVFTVGIAGDDT